LPLPHASFQRRIQVPLDAADDADELRWECRRLVGTMVGFPLETLLDFISCLILQPASDLWQDTVETDLLVCQHAVDLRQDTVETDFYCMQFAGWIALTCHWTVA
jgi:hypothetical protein